MNNEFLSCDWGTSNFRIRLVSIPDLQIVAEESSEKGISETFIAWEKTSEQDEQKKLLFYTAIIKEHIDKLEKKLNKSFDDVPVIISGMASSSIGLINLPYKQLPFHISGKDLITKSYDATPAFRHNVLLISGVKTNDDVIRGEETQLIGCIPPEVQVSGKESLFIHPGTHSKHITVKGSEVTGFKTYMTGEFFKLFTTHSILHTSVQICKGEPDSFKSFENGVGDAKNSNLLHSIFKVRTNNLFSKMTKEENYFYMSGLLIGYELQELKHFDAEIFLCSGSSLINYYDKALAVLNLKDKVNVLPAKWVDESVIRGQYKIYKNLQQV